MVSSFHRGLAAPPPNSARISSRENVSSPGIPVFRSSSRSLDMVLTCFA
ncbi:Uncharacterised protein [Flavonifractor plautii]|uniref:Uncharacterized protein n=1 Tax=Flavonifractor plautii TaxID=292800 RepID=A0A174WCZ1_FLAPL|nr:Uncharacterised protein [Flavonifractor plautii]